MTTGTVHRRKYGCAQWVCLLFALLLSLQPIQVSSAAAPAPAPAPAPSATAAARQQSGQQLEPELPEQWHASLLDVTLNARPLLHASSPSLLGPTLHKWTFSLPLEALRQGTGFLGSSHRLRRAIRAALNGESIKIGVIGGHTTFGDGASHKGRTDWVSLLSTWAADALGSVTTLNGALPGTPSSYAVMCLEHSVEQDVDIVFAEYVSDDGFDDQVARNEKTAAYEKLVRRVLALPKKPAMVMLQMPRSGVASDTGQPRWVPFHATLETVYAALAQYYDVQYLSFRSATYRLAKWVKAPGLTYEDLMEPTELKTHPVDAGHKVMADLAVWLLQQTVLDLLLRPWGHADVEQLQEEMPPPMMPGNAVPAAVMCVQGDTFRKVVTAAKGWRYVNEGTDKRPRTGYVADRPGSTLTLDLDTARPGAKGDVVVSISHLRAHENMGKATASCLSGCNCTAITMDGHHATRDMRTYRSVLMVSQHRSCVLELKVLQESSSGKHKFKVSSITVSETAVPSHVPHAPDGYSFDPANLMARHKALGAQG